MESGLERFFGSWTEGIVGGGDSFINCLEELRGTLDSADTRKFWTPRSSSGLTVSVNCSTCAILNPKSPGSDIDGNHKDEIRKRIRELEEAIRCD